MSSTCSHHDHAQVCELWRHYLLQERVWQKAVEKFAQRWEQVDFAQRWEKVNFAQGWEQVDFAQTWDNLISGAMSQNFKSIKAN